MNRAAAARYGELVALAEAAALEEDQLSGFGASGISGRYRQPMDGSWWYGPRSARACAAAGERCNCLIESAPGAGAEAEELR